MATWQSGMISRYRVKSVCKREYLCSLRRSSERNTKPAIDGIGRADTTVSWVRANSFASLYKYIFIWFRPYFGIFLILLHVYLLNEGNLFIG